MPAANTKVFVVDASFILSYLLPDERIMNTDLIFKKFQSGQITFLSTKLLPFEVLNSLKQAVIRKRISNPKATQLMKVFLDYHIFVEGVDFNETFQLALNTDLTVYDASYLYLAKENSLELLTLDDRLKKLTLNLNHP